MTSAELTSIDLAGKAEARAAWVAKAGKRVVPVMLAGALVAGVKYYFA